LFTERIKTILFKNQRYFSEIKEITETKKNRSKNNERTIKIVIFRKKFDDENCEDCMMNSCMRWIYGGSRWNTDSHTAGRDKKRKSVI